MENGLDLLEQLIEDAKAAKVQKVPLFERLAEKCLEVSKEWAWHGAKEHSREVHEIAQMLISVQKMVDKCKDKTLMNDLTEVIK